MNEEPTNNRKGGVVTVKGMWALLGAVLIGFLSGVGSFQMLVAGEVRAHGIEILNLKEQEKNDKAFVEQRMASLAMLMEANNKLNSDLINLVREENNLVREQNRLIERYYLNSSK